jgi:hypothetical protein
MGRSACLRGAQPRGRTLSPERGIAVSVDRGVVTLRLTSVPSATEATRFAQDTLAGLRAVGTKGLRALLVDLSGSGAADGAQHARLATALAETLAQWEGRGLPVAVFAPDKRAALEATRVVAGSCPRWGRVVRSMEDAERYLG